MFDLPPMTVQVTEHQLIARRCGCGATTCGAAPEGVSAPVQYGPRITAIILYLYVGQFLSKKRTAAALAELFGTPVCRRHRGRYEPPCRRRARRVPHPGQRPDRRRRSGRVRRDRAARGRASWHWVHCARTGKYTLITCHPKRGASGHRRRRGPRPVPRGRGARRLGPLRHLRSMPNINCAAPTRSVSWPPSPTPRRPMPTGAGPPRPVTRWSPCRSWWPRRSPPAPTPSTPTPWPSQIQLYRSAAQIGLTQTAARGPAR